MGRCVFPLWNSRQYVVDKRYRKPLGTTIPFSSP